MARGSVSEVVRTSVLGRQSLSDFSYPHPVRSNERAADRERNRRIEVQVLPAVAELPLLPVVT